MFLACGIAGVAIAAKTFHDAAQADIARFVTSLLALTFATNFVTSSLITIFFWKARKELSPQRGHQKTSDPLSKIIRVAVESGVLYTSSILLLLIIYAAGSHLSQIPMSRIVRRSSALR
jgi:hypothetical protein